MGDFKANSKAKAKLPQGDLLFGHPAIVCHAILWVCTQAGSARRLSKYGKWRDYQWANYNLASNNSHNTSQTTTMLTRQCALFLLKNDSGFL